MNRGFDEQKDRGEFACKILSHMTKEQATKALSHKEWTISGTYINSDGVG